MEAQKILEQHRLKVTQGRIKILLLLMDNGKAVSCADLLKKLADGSHRVSVYRTINLFLAEGIVTRIVDASGISKYIFRRHDKEKTALPYFKCRHCDSVVELPQLPKSYLLQLECIHIEKINILVEGICPDCSNNQTDHGTD